MTHSTHNPHDHRQSLRRRATDLLGPLLLVFACGTPAAHAQLDDGTFSVCEVSSGAPYASSCQTVASIVSSSGQMETERWSVSQKFWASLHSEAGWVPSGPYLLRQAQSANPSVLAVRWMGPGSPNGLQAQASYRYLQAGPNLLRWLAHDLRATHGDLSDLRAAFVIDGENGEVTGVLVMELGPGQTVQQNWVLSPDYRPPDPGGRLPDEMRSEAASRNGYTDHLLLRPVTASEALRRISGWASPKGEFGKFLGWYAGLSLQFAVLPPSR